jgi:hydroxyethylthiazole kinase-like uncharacterized protein yjeF
MKVATAEVMRRLDQKAIQEFGIPGLVLMENAARSTVSAMFHHFRGLLTQRVGIFAGRGNNGGDALAVARHLLNRGVSCQVYLLTPEGEVRGDAATNLQILTRMGAEIFPIANAKEWEACQAKAIQNDLFVDGIFGTGLKGPVGGIHQKVIEFINALHRPVVAMDIPSGLDADRGRILGTCIRAALTVTFGLAKTGLLLQPGKQVAGKLLVADISIPSAAIEAEPIKDHLIVGDDFSHHLPPRKPDAHKGDFGHLFVLSGSPGKTGAAALLCQAAVRVGTGLVTLGIPESLNPIMEVKMTEAMTEPLPETKDKTLALKARSRIHELLLKKNALAVGPGLSLNAETARLIRRLVQETDLPTVIDADGLSAWVGKMDLIQKTKRKGTVVFTPHPGEMARLLQCPIQQVQRDRIQVARNFAQTHGQVLILKGADSLVATPEGEIFINPTGNPGMATGGMGDVLTGMVGGFLAQGLPPVEAAKLGVFLHGLAGDWVAHRKGERGMAATDLIEEIPRLLQALACKRGQIDDFSFPPRVERAD